MISQMIPAFWDSAKCITDSFATFWCHLWSISEQMHDNINPYTPMSDQDRIVSLQYQTDK